MHGAGHSMNEGFNPVKVQGLAQADHRTKMQDFFFLVLRQETRDQGHRHPTEMTDPLQDFFSIHERHRRVKEDKVVTLSLDLPESFLAVQGTIHFITFLLEGLTKLLTDHFFIIDDQQLNDG